MGGNYVLNSNRKVIICGTNDILNCGKVSEKEAKCFNYIKQILKGGSSVLTETSFYGLN